MRTFSPGKAMVRGDAETRHICDVLRLMQSEHHMFLRKYYHQSDTARTPNPLHKRDQARPPSRYVREATSDRNASRHSGYR